MCDGGITALAGKCPELEELFIAQCERITSKGLFALTKTTPGLTKLSVSMPDLTDTDMTTLAQHCPMLHTLLLTNIYLVTDIGIHAIVSHCSKLEKMCFTNCSAVSIGYSLFRNLKQLRIDISPTLTDTMVATIVQNNPILERLILSRCTQLTSASVLSILQGCSELHNLTVNNTPAGTDSSMTGQMSVLMSTLIKQQYPKISEAEITIV